MTKKKFVDKTKHEDVETVSIVLNQNNNKFNYKEPEINIKNPIVRPFSTRYEEPDALTKTPIIGPSYSKNESRSKTPVINNRKEVAQYNSNVSTNSNSYSSNNVNIYKPKITQTGVNSILNNRINIQTPLGVKK
jgi:hypothetical protein